MRANQKKLKWSTVIVTGALFSNILLAGCGEGGPFKVGQEGAGKTVVTNYYKTRIVGADPDGDGFTADPAGGDVQTLICGEAENDTDKQVCQSVVEGALHGTGDCDGFVGDDPAICGQLPAEGGCNDVRFSACARCINPSATEVDDDVDNDCDGLVDEGFGPPPPACVANIDCDAPPPPACNGQFVANFNGTCVDGACQYNPTNVEACAFGCADGACLPACDADQACANDIPAAACDPQTSELVTFTGACVNSACEFPELGRQACAFGCAAGACLPDPCAGVICDDPPAPACQGNVLITSGDNGVCANGGCSYATAQQNCAFGCADGACLPDPCLGVVCNDPPGSLCNAGILTTFEALGVCNAADCSYPSHNQACQFGCNAQNNGCANDPCSGVQCGLEQVCVLDVNGAAECVAIPCDPANDVNGEDFGDCADFRPAALDDLIYGFGCHLQRRVCIVYEDRDFDEWADDHETVCNDLVDGDVDGNADAADGDCVDADNDGVLNGVDNCRDVANPIQTNSDADTRGDACDNCPLANNQDQADVDGDGLGNACDALNCVPSNGGVEICDLQDNNCNGQADEGLNCVPDTDRDGINDDADNCPLVVNPLQEDADHNGVGDACQLVAPPAAGPDVCFDFFVTITVRARVQWWPAAGPAHRSQVLDPGTYPSQPGECSATGTPVQAPPPAGWCSGQNPFGFSPCGILPLGGEGFSHNQPGQPR